MNNLTLKAKLFTLMAVALLSLLAVGGIGWNGIGHVDEAMDEIGSVRLPSVLGLQIVSEGQTAVRSANRYVAFFENDYKAQAKFAEELKDKEEIWKRIEKGWKIYEPLPQTAEETVLWNQFVKEWGDWKAADAKVTETIAAMSNNTSANPKEVEKRQKELFAEFYQRAEATMHLFEQSENTLIKIIDLNVKYGDDAKAGGDADAAMAKRNMLAGSAILLVILLLLGVWIMRSILNQLGGEPAYVADVVKRVAEGDLTVQVQTKANDHGSMLFAIKGMIDKLS
ncbi:MAG: MCP four helix bundle domain-containing protein, partial [Gallionella sp.]|nr:MCP four helix bundle domain-containing protein [Gallionella sp.]